MPFVCLGLGFIAGLITKVKNFFKLTDLMSSVALAIIAFNKCLNF